MLATKEIVKGYHPLEASTDLDPLLERIGDAKYVLLGEASHGTHEYYTWRTAISKRLIEEKGFSFIPVEGDWPDCYRINIRSTSSQLVIRCRRLIRLDFKTRIPIFGTVLLNEDKSTLNFK